MNHHISTRARTLALLGATGLLAALLVSAPAAPAATIHACQKKKGGTIRIVGSKTKCKKTEKKVKWSTSGKNGKNGASGTNGINGINGTNGTAGAPGAPGATGPQGPGAARLAGDLGSIGLLTDVTAAQATVAGVTIKLSCGNALVLNFASIKVTSPADGTLWTQSVYRENTDNAIDEPQTTFTYDALTANSEESHTVAVAGGDASPNESTFLSVIDSGSTTVVVSGGTSVGTGCKVRATAVPATSAA